MRPHRRYATSGSELGTAAAAFQAGLEAETIFLPCTSGLPDTSPAGESGQPGDADELAAWAAGLGLEAGDLDDLVHDAYSRQASEMNNGGLGSQVRFLIEYLRHRGRPVPAQRPAAAARATQRRSAAPAAGGAAPAVGSRASSARRLACCQAGPPRQRGGRPGPAFTPAGG